MNQFYMNHAIGAPSSVADGSKALANALMAFGEIESDASLKVADRIVLECDPDLMTFGDVHLYELVEGIRDKELRQYAYICLKKAFPLEAYFEMDKEAWRVAEGEYRFEGEDATSHAVVHRHGGFLFTMAFKPSLRQDQLVVESAVAAASSESSSSVDRKVSSSGARAIDYPPLYVNNLWGSDANTDYILGILNQRKRAAADPLVEVQKYGITIPAFENLFTRLPRNEQDAILDGFAEAQQNNMLTPLKPNEKLVRSLTGTKSEFICELALYQPVACRVYLTYYQGSLYIIGHAYKKDIGRSPKHIENKTICAFEKKFKEFVGKR